VGATRSAPDLDARVVQRAASRAHLPLIEPVRPAVRHEEQGRKGESVSGATDLLLHVPATELAREPPRADQRLARAEQRPAPDALPLRIQRAPAVQVQRQPAEASPVAWMRAVTGPQVQRLGEEELPEKEEQEPGAPKEEEEQPEDLEDMARNILPLIRRMLAIERERRAPR
jgi:hypothetical protein